MTYIVPNGRVQFYKEFGLSPSYENTLYFPTMEARNTYFDNNLTPIAEGTAMSYSRATRGYIRVQLPMATLIHAGYMRFRNTGFEDKWFYAFVTNVEYINNECTEVQFELDYMMTWMGAFKLLDCMVERMHHPTDNIGDNIVDEGIPCGDVLYGKPIASGWLGSEGWTFCFASTFDPEGEVTPTPTPDPDEPTDPDNPDEPTDPDDPDIVIIQGWDGGMYGGIYSGLHYAYTDSESTLNQWIRDAVSAGRSSGIIGIAICPKAFTVNDGDNVVQKTITRPKPQVGDYFKYKYSGQSQQHASELYQPKNNKMYTYPYRFLSVTNMEGNWADFRYEMFDANSCNFTLQGISGLQTELVLSPHNYKWNCDDSLLSGEWVANPGEKMSMSDFPMCSYLTDPYMAYLAQNKSSIAASVVSSAIGAGTNIAKSAMVGGAPMAMLTAGTEAINMERQAIQFLGNLADYARKPMQLNGSQGSSALFGEIGLASDQLKVYKEFWFYDRSITPQYAKIIDNYFTMYGYRQGRVITPQMHVRTHWTYVKTIGCNVSAKGDSLSNSLPADHARKIEEIFDRGVRFWVDHTEIGQYGLVNAPLT